MVHDKDGYSPSTFFFRFSGKKKKKKKETFTFSSGFFNQESELCQKKLIFSLLAYTVNPTDQYSQSELYCCDENTFVSRSTSIKVRPFFLNPPFLLALPLNCQAHFSSCDVEKTI